MDTQTYQQTGKGSVMLYNQIIEITKSARAQFAAGAIDSAVRCIQREASLGKTSVILHPIIYAKNEVRIHLKNAGFDVADYNNGLLVKWYLD